MTDITRISEAEIDTLAATGDVWDAEPVLDPTVDAALTALENDPKPIFQGYTYRELIAAFSVVENPDDWKAAVFGFVTEKNLEVTKAAVEFFTATEPFPVPVGGTWYRITAIGYRMGPAGDH